MKKYYILFLLYIAAVIQTNAQNKRSVLADGITIRVNDPSSSEIIRNYDYPTKKIFKAIEEIILEEKIALKKEVQSIEDQLSLKKITVFEAEKLKKEVANNHALNIEKRIALQDVELQKIIQDYADNQVATISVDSVEVEMLHGNARGKKWDRKEKMTVERLNRYKKIIAEHNLKRNDEQGVIAFGLNHVIIDNKLSKDYKIGSSKFYEYGYTYKYRLSKNPSPFYFKYGASLLFNNLKTTKNLYHIKSENETNLITHSKDLKVSRLKNVQLIFPVHFEVDLSKPDLVDGLESSRKEKSFRFGLGGYGGVRLHTRQILKYEENGISVKEKSTDHFNLNNFTYGLSGYLGYRSTSLYMKYDINTLFKNGNGRGISLGLRLEI